MSERLRALGAVQPGVEHDADQSDTDRPGDPAERDRSLEWLAGYCATVSSSTEILETIDAQGELPRKKVKIYPWGQPGDIRPDAVIPRNENPGSEARSGIMYARLQTHRVGGLLDIGLDAVLDEDSVPDHEDQQCPQSTAVVGLATAVTLQHGLDRRLVEQVIGL